MIRKLLRRSLPALAALAAALPATAQKSRGTPDLRLAQVADSAALVQGLRGLPAPPAGPAQTYSLDYDSTGARVAVHSLFQGAADYDSAVVEVLTRLTAAHVTPARAGSLMIQAAGGADARVRTYPGRGREDQPRVTNATVVSMGLQRIYDRYRDLLPGRQAAVSVRMRVDFDGTVAEPVVVSGSGVAGLDRDVVELARSITFRPGRIDGRAVRTWVTLPFSLVPPAAPFGQPAG